MYQFLIMLLERADFVSETTGRYEITTSEIAKLTIAIVTI